ncbi:NUDIX hydrolase [Paraburkholderia sp. DHOC27]|uniref:NUDIX hydrolase n=1 Tax=Paraburkholderia sp. DHOC27 TaxID=2303330 RepID=UPI000E3C3989|nr:NUDIX hydrolase [Paraburkholderia sp. DHOC27]RFU49635.1 NUDIX domain-containing protein [Paraburkholderia sp. DHOC27]
MLEPADLTQRRLEQARRLLAIAQTGLHYTTGAFDKERYEELEAIAQAQLADLANLRTEQVAALFAHEVGYANPKLDVRCAVFDAAGRVLLVREAADGRWSLPGGWADIGATPAENAMREVREESGYTVTIERLLAIWDMPRHAHPPSVFNIWKLVFLGKLAAGGDGSGENIEGNIEDRRADIFGVETDAEGFFAVDALPPLSLGRILPEQIRRLRELRDNGGMEFD